VYPALLRFAEFAYRDACAAHGIELDAAALPGIHQEQLAARRRSAVAEARQAGQQPSGSHGTPPAAPGTESTKRTPVPVGDQVHEHDCMDV
jgi:hypothetical protein